MKTRNPVESLASAHHEFGEHGGVNMSVEASTTFTVSHSRTMPEIFRGQKGPEQGGCYLYGRHFNPTVYNLGKQLAALEGTEAAYCTASGMSAISATLLQLCDAQDHIVSSNTIYGGTYALMHDLPGNDNTGIHIGGAQVTVVQGNFIGTDVTGASALGNNGATALPDTWSARACWSEIPGTLTLQPMA